MYDILRLKASGLSEEMVAFAQAMIHTPSPSGQEGNVASLAHKEMTRLGYDRVERDATGNIIGILHGCEGSPVLLLNCHMDTVAPDADRWKSDPFGGTVKDGRLIGRGAADCKGGLAAQIYAGAILKRALLPLRGTVVVAATVAEENGLSLGVRNLVAETLPAMGCRPDYAILGEPTDLGLYYGHDGRMELEVIVAGADPFQVDDAAAAILKELAQSAPVRNEPVEDLAVQSPRYETKGGVRRAVIAMERRLKPSENAAAVTGQLKQMALLAAGSGSAVAVEVAVRKEVQKHYTGVAAAVQRVAEAWTTDPFSFVMDRSRQILSAAGCPVRPGRWVLDRLGMGTAGGVLTRDFKIQTIGYGPGAEDQAHAPDESVSIANIQAAAYGTAAIAHGLAGIPVFGWNVADI